MRDASFTLLPQAPGQPPFAAVYTVESMARAFWRILDATAADVGMAMTRAGARLALRALYASASAPSLEPSS